MELLVELNGTSENPYHKMGLTQNPFPQTAKYDLHSELAADVLGRKR